MPPGERIATSVELRHSPSAKAASGTMPTSTPSLRERLSDEVALVDADQFGEDLVCVDDAALAVAMDDEVAERVDQAAKALLAFLQLPHAVGEASRFPRDCARCSPTRWTGRDSRPGAPARA